MSFAPRSLLYVPASKPRMLDRLADLPADVLAVDLEDGVPPVEKNAARGNLRAASSRGSLPPGRWLLRINPPGTRWHEDDLTLARDLEAPRVLVPKAEDPGAVVSLAARLWGNGISTALMIETAAGVGRARELAGCHRGIDLLVYGSADLRLSLRARPDPDRVWERHALGEILLAARMHGCAALDAVYFLFHDREGLVRDARVARNLGFDGKSCIHPLQVAPVHEVFATTPDEAEWARRVLREWDEQDGDSRGVIVVDGEMVEALHVAVARGFLRRWEAGDGTEA